MATASAAERSALADFLRDRRNDLNLKQEAVAARVGRQLNWYSRVERGARSYLRAAEIDALEQALELPEGALLKLARRGY